MSQVERRKFIRLGDKSGGRSNGNKIQNGEALWSSDIKPKEAKLVEEPKSFLWMTRFQHHFDVLD